MRHLMIGTAVVLAVFAATPRAQQLTQPPGWRWVLDRPAPYVTEVKPPPGAFLFGQMPPGWHITTGPGAVLFDPDRVAGGRYSLEAEIFLFPGTSQEGYGVFVGGTNLDADAPAYTAFILRRDRSAAVVRRQGTETTFMRPWTRHDAVASQAGEEPARNVIRVEVRADDVRLLANDEEVAVFPRGALGLDGAFGFRIGEDLNLHAATLDFIQHLAPATP